MLRRRAVLCGEGRRHCGFRIVEILRGRSPGAAGCSVVFEGCARQAEDAKTLTDKPRPDMPKALWAALVNLSERKKSDVPKTKAVPKFKAGVSKVKAEL